MLMRYSPDLGDSTKFNRRTKENSFGSNSLPDCAIESPVVTVQFF